MASAGHPSSWVLLSVLGLFVFTGFTQAAEPLEFHLRFDPAVSKTPFSGRVYVMLSKRPSKQLPNGPRWVNTEPFFADDVKDWKPGEIHRLTNDALSFPKRLNELTKGTYWATAIMDFDQGGRSFARCPGNGYGDAVKIEIDPGNSGPQLLNIDKVYQPPVFKETDRVKLVEIESKLLTAFHRRPMFLRAGVVLPKSYADQPKTHYPVIYAIPGFGGNHFGAFSAAARNATNVGGEEMIYVVLDPSCRLGHHVFADSENNGPCGQALCAELIPAIERCYRALARPSARFVTGHSSGGWSSLWLQVRYPDYFGGVWSTAPDPVDFRDFQRVNIYRPKTNIYVDEAGKRRPLGRRGKKVFLWYKPFSDMEAVMGRGGQLGSFEAVFSPRGKDGQPQKLWDRRTGDIAPEVAKSWQRYDIRLILERSWKQLGPKLAGKIHVYMGEIDTFYLDGATRLLQQSLKRLDSDAVVEIFPGRDHGTLLSPSLRERIAREMAEAFRANHSN